MISIFSKRTSIRHDQVEPFFPLVPGGLLKKFPLVEIRLDDKIWYPD